MKKPLLEYLHYKNPKCYSKTEEQFYFDNHLFYFSPATRNFRRNDDFFTLLKADIVLKGLENRAKINQYLIENKDHLSRDDYHRFLSSLPQYRDKNNPVLIPTYSPSVNRRYYFKPETLFNFPYDVLLKDNASSLINPFEIYGNKPFYSFCNLMPLSIHDIDTIAFYHEEMETIYVINDCGGLDASIPLFDEKLKNPDKTNLNYRLSLLVKNYYENDKSAFLDHLESLSLVSNSLKQDLVEFEKRRKLKKERIQYK